MCQGFSHFSGFLHHFVSATLATTSIKVKEEKIGEKEEEDEEEEKDDKEVDKDEEVKDIVYCIIKQT